jgi:hypothetical protein
MSAKPVAAAPVQPVPAEAVPTTQYERFLAALPESFRSECRSKLEGFGLAANHPAFLALAQLYEKDREKPPRDFIHEATLHADQSTQLLNELRSLPEAIMAKIEPQLVGLLSALRNPLQRLEVISVALQSPAQPFPVQTPPIPAHAPPSENPNGPPPPPKPAKAENKLWQVVGQFLCTAASTVSNPLAWIVTGSISVSIAVTIFSLGAAHLSRSYEAAYQDRVAHMEADSAADTVALNRLLVAGLTLKVEQSPDREGWYLILPGARKAAQPVNSPEGLAVEVWP